MKKTADYPLWFKVARDEIGVKEIPGSGNNPRIMEYHGATKGGKSPDEIPWCSSFACWCMEQVGIKSTRSKWAKDWLEWGIALDEGKVGAITVFTRNGGGHVGFYVDEDDDGIFVLGGNQKDSVNISYYSWDNFLDYRWPEEV